jgi:antibiotic biosynthesis monooxygenase (ABM) superfamily enzyme
MSTPEPVTVVEKRTLQPGRERDYQAWVNRISAASGRFPGNQGITVLVPEADDQGERYLIIRFVDETARRRWTQSEEWARLRQEGAAFSTPQVQTATGAEPWFILPGQQVRTPPKWKMSLVVIPSAYVVSSAAVALADAALRHWPFLVVNLIVTVLLGFLLTYVGLPLSTRLLHHWLYPAGAAE